MSLLLLFHTSVIVPPPTFPSGFCGGGYGGGPYAAMEYGGAVPCNGTSQVGLDIESNVVEYCRIITSCGD